MFCADRRGVLAITTQFATRSGKVMAQLRACMPPRDPPITAAKLFHRQHRKRGAPGLAGGGVDAGRARRPEARAQVVDADHEENVGVHRLAGAHHVVPPPHVAGVVRRLPRHIVRVIERMADQDRVGALGVQRAVGFHGKFWVRQDRRNRDQRRRKS
ncbi:hypothetical protein G6F68_016537 [Rhizopus microsporus]|nr:hypothetical protein G6F68_016537 [Rhizopus microsporus]